MTIKCPKCGAENPDDARKCGYCSEDLQPQASQPPQPTQQAPYGQQPYGAQQGGNQQPGQPYYQAAPVAVPDYLVWSILATLFCCLPFGVIAIVKSAEANSKKNVGDYQGALAAANSAKTWLYVSAGLGLAFGVIYAIVAILGVAAGL